MPLWEQVNITDIVEDVTTFMKHKNPAVKTETTRWLVRCFRSTRNPPEKGDIKPLADSLRVAQEDGFEPVRSAACEALGTLMKLVGERAFGPFLEGMDDIRKAKVKDAFEKAEVKCKVRAAPAAAPPPVRQTGTQKKAPPKPVSWHPFCYIFLVTRWLTLVSTDPQETAGDLEQQRECRAFPFALCSHQAGFQRTAGSCGGKFAWSKNLFLGAILITEAEQAKKPGAPSAPAAKKPAAAGAPSGGASKGNAKPTPTEPLRYKYSQEDAEAQAASVLPSEIIEELANSNWKARLAAIESLHDSLAGGEVSSCDAELVVRYLSKKPGWKESNFQVKHSSSRIFFIYTFFKIQLLTF
jgi:cytoskeleton-associated protein 5